MYKGRTALMKAAELGNVQAIEILKKAKADATIRDFEGRGSWKTTNYRIRLKNMVFIIK